jgi:glycosyltransferase involved in cell wall biosynthesis
MNYSIIMPAHNEAQFIALTLDSILKQSVVPKQLIIVNDHSTDETQRIALEYAQKHLWISVVESQSTAIHEPGSKVINAFKKGIPELNRDFDVIVKADADLIFPPNYFETILHHFSTKNTIGMAGGFAYIQKNNDWILENLTDKDHIRGAFKAYRKECFEQIGGLQSAMGWDTVDELLCRYYGWEIVTDEQLVVKHLKPTGANYNKFSRYKQGEAFYRLGYGITITTIAALKLATRKGKPLLFIDYIKGFYKAKREKKPLLVTPDQAQFIRNFRWKKIKDKLL